MKKTLALLLALLMVTSCMVFTTAAEETATVADDELKIIPISDCSGPSTLSKTASSSATGEGWWGDGPDVVEDGVTVIKTAEYTSDGAITSTVVGIPKKQGSGNVIHFAFHTENTRDISDMNMLVFDLYLENAAGVVNCQFDFELRSKGWTGDGTEINYNAVKLAALSSTPLVDGWNHIEIPLSKFNTNAAYDATEWCYFRMFQRGAGAPDENGLFSSPANVVGTEGKTTVVKLDNLYFSSATEKTETESDGFILNSGAAQIKYTAAADIGAGGEMQYKTVLATPIDINKYKTFNIDVYLSHEDAASRAFNIELTSSGRSDSEEDNMGDTIAVLADRAGVTLARGWNHLEIPLNTRSMGSLDETQFDFYRIFNNAWTAGTYADGVTRTVIIARATLGGDTTGLRAVDIWSGEKAMFGGSTNGSIADVVNEDGELVGAEGVVTDGKKEWVWFNTQGASKTINGADAWGTFSLSHSRPFCENFYGLQFDIYVSDAAFGNSSINFEMTSAGKCDYEEISKTSTLNALTGTTLEAGKWQTVSILCSKLTDKTTGEGNVFVPYEFDYIRMWKTSPTQTFENGLVVATRNFKALNYVPVTEDEKGNVVLDIDTGIASGNRIQVPGKDGLGYTMAANMLNVAQGGNLITTGASNVNDSVLTSAHDISKADYIGFDLYLENVDYWGDKVNFLMGISSYGNCDHQQITSSGKTIKQMFGDHVVNEDGSKGTLKDGWNRVEMPIYSLFYHSSINGADERVCFDPTNFNYFRTYVQPGTATTAEMKSVAALDNITFFDGGVIGTRDDVITGGPGSEVNALYTGPVASGTRAHLALYHPMDATDKDMLVFDVKVTGKTLFNNIFRFEIASSLASDAKEAEIGIDLDDYGIVEGEWTTVEVPLSLFDLENNTKGIDLSDIIRINFFPNAALPAGYKVEIDNVRFAKRGDIGTKIASAQPTLTESIDFITKTTVATADVKAVTVEYILKGDAGVKRVIAPNSVLSASTNGMNATYSSGFDGIPAHRMTDTLSMTVWYTDADGVMHKGETREYSVQQYAKNMLKNNSSNAKLVTLLSDLLVYGAAVQAYANNYNADALATDVGEDITLKPTTTFTVPEKLTTVLDGTPADDEFDATFKTATLVLDGTVKIRYGFAANTVEGLTVNVNGTPYTEFTTGTATNGTPLYYVEVPVNANHFGTTFTADFNGNTDYVVNYSVNHYVATKYEGAVPKMAALLAALYNYGASAVAYAEN